MKLPENGNFVPHEKLFDPMTAARAPKIAASPARLWRTLPVSYRDKMDAWLKSHGAIDAKRGYGGDVLAAPFGLQTAQEIKNYSFLYTLEGAQTAGLANNARLALIRVVDYNPKDGRSLIRKLAVATESPSTEDVDKVIVELYRHWIGRSPDEKELTAKRTIVLERVKKLGNRAGLVAGLVPIMIHPEAFFHAELGTPKNPGEPTFLPPDELIDALDRALRDRRGEDPMRKDANWQIAEVSSQTDDYPVTNITRNDARKFCEWLAKQSDSKIRLREVRLPGEAEWEFACRVGSTHRFSFGDEDERLTAFANVADATWAERFSKSSAIQAKDGYAFSSPVGQFKPNAFGLYDMHGNVWEWCEDYYGKYSALPKERNAIQSVSQGQRRPVMRGGAWYVGPSGCRCANRWLVGVGGRYGSGGFRVVCIP